MWNFPLLCSRFLLPKCDVGWKKQVASGLHGDGCLRDHAVSIFSLSYRSGLMGLEMQCLRLFRLQVFGQAVSSEQDERQDTANRRVGHDLRLLMLEFGDRRQRVGPTAQAEWHAHFSCFCMRANWYASLKFLGRSNTHFSCEGAATENKQKPSRNANPMTAALRGCNHQTRGIWLEDVQATHPKPEACNLFSSGIADLS